MMIGSWSLLIFGGLPRVTGDGFQGSHCIASKSSLSQRFSSILRLIARTRTNP